MFNLLSAECFKLRKSKNLYICCSVVVFFIIFIYGMLLLAENIQSGNVQNGTGGVYVTQEATTEGLIMENLNVLDFYQQLFTGEFISILLAIFVSILVVEEFKSGAIKNVVGKGYARETVFLAKFFSAAIGVALLLLVSAVVTILAGLFFLGEHALYPGILADFGSFFGLQLWMSVALSAVFVLISEIGRNVAAAISAGIGVVIVSGMLFSGLDMLFKGSGFHPSEYWLICMSELCPAGGFETGYVVKTVVVSLLWIAVALAAGIWHFKRADVK